MARLFLSFLLLIPTLTLCNGLRLIVIPSFQSTLLYHSGEPIFLAPITFATYPEVYRRLQHSSTKCDETKSFDSIHYPKFLCAPDPFSHAGHCNPLPETGPIPALVSQLQKLIDGQDDKLFALPYDWRLTVAEHAKGFFGSTLRQYLARNSTILAHGSGCHVVSSILRRNPTLQSNVDKLLCAAPIPVDFYTDALSKGEGIIAYGDAHIEADAQTNVRLPNRIDFKPMQFELGVHPSRRTLLPDTAGPWDRNRTFVSSPSERVKLALSFASLREMADHVSYGADKTNSICIKGVGHETIKNGQVVDGDGIIAGESGCERFDGRVVEVHASHFDLVALFLPFLS